MEEFRDKFEGSRELKSKGTPEQIQDTGGLMFGYWPLRISQNNIQEQLNRIEQCPAVQKPDRKIWSNAPGFKVTPQSPYPCGSLERC